MKKIMIVNNNMHIGGVQKSLLNLLKNISDKYDVTLLLFYKGGALLEDIPENVHIIEASSPFRYLGMTKNDVGPGFLNKAMRAFFAGLTRLFSIGVSTRVMSLFQRKLSGYDAAISFYHSGAKKAFNGGCNEFVIRHIDAKRKITFLHCDYLKINADIKANHSIYSQFDKIAACSDGCRRSFLSAEPEFENKTTVVYNCCDFDDVIDKSAQSKNLTQSNKINFVTVARLGREKSVSRAVQAFAQLADYKDKVHYYIIGSGIEGNLIKNMIADYGLENQITMCGEKKNPYPFIKSADCLLIPSISEAAPMVIAEAACLGVPVLTTKTSSAEEMVEHTGYGWVCDNDVDSIRNAVMHLIHNPKLIEECSKFLKEQSFNNDLALAQFEKLLK